MADYKIGFRRVTYPTLIAVIEQIQRRKESCLAEILGKIERENPLVVPLVASYEFIGNRIPKYSSVVYELLSLSSEKPLPTVDEDTVNIIKIKVGEKMRLNPLNALDDIIGQIFKENPVIIYYLNIASIKTTQRGIFSESAVVYWLLRHQAIKDSARDN